MNKLSKNLLMASFVGSFAEIMITPVWTALTERVGGSELDAGAGWAAFLITTGIAIYLLGKSKFYKEHLQSMVFWGFVVSGIGEFSYIFVHNKWQLFLVQAIVGLSVGILGPAWDSLYSDDGQQSDVERWSFWTGGISLVTGLGAIMGAAILTYLGWNALFISMGIIDALAVYYSYQVLIYKEQTV